jgi:hypothetical protein
MLYPHGPTSAGLSLSSTAIDRSPVLKGWQNVNRLGTALMAANPTPQNEVGCPLFQMTGITWATATALSPLVSLNLFLQGHTLLDGRTGS